MSVRLADVIEVLDESYPPRLAESWDSVGLVCGDPDDVLDSVTVAVDATAAVVDEVPEGGLLLAHHPLLLRGVDSVAASTETCLRVAPASRIAANRCSRRAADSRVAVAMKISTGARMASATTDRMRSLALAGAPPLVGM